MFRLWSRLDRYLISQLFWIVLFTLMLFSIIWLAPDTLFKLTQYVFSGEVSVSQALLMFVYHLPAVLLQTIPVAVLLGSIFLFQRLSQNYELIAMLASGISPARQSDIDALPKRVLTLNYNDTQQYGPHIEVRVKDDAGQVHTRRARFYFPNRFPKTPEQFWEKAIQMADTLARRFEKK
jgi:hypothetical protein